MPDWPLVELSELVEDLTVGFVGSMTQEYVDTGVPFFRSKNIKPYDLDWGDIKYVSQEFHEKLKKSALKPGDVVIVRTGKPGTACVIPDSVEVANCSDVVIARVDDKKLSAHYLSYFMNSVAAHQVSSHLVGAVQQHFNVSSAKKIKIPLPSRNEQEEIVAVLKALDDKLKLNRQINQTLEQIAQAIFKSWFVDFEPVKAKIEAKQNGQDPERAAMRAISGKTDEELDQLVPEQRQQLATTAILFPDELEDSENGEIPKGWNMVPLYETAEFINGAAFKASDFSSNNEGLPIIKIAELKSGIIPQTKYTTKEVADKYYIDDDEMLYSWSGSPGTSLEVFKWFGGKAILNQHIFRVITEIPEQKYFVFYLLRYLKPELIAMAENKQTTGLGHVTVADMKRLIIPQPEVNILKEFGHTVGQLYEKCSVLDRQTLTLAETRDAMLPQLLSGELDIKNKKAAV